VFDPSGKDNIGHSSLDHCHTRNNGLHARYAHPVDGNGRNGIRYSCQQSTDPGNVQCIAGFHAASVTYVIYYRRVDVSPFNGFLHGYTGQLCSIAVAKGAAKGTDGCPASRYNDNVFHNFPLLRYDFENIIIILN
jgi:hypothetical protein